MSRKLWNCLVALLENCFLSIKLLHYNVPRALWRMSTYACKGVVNKSLLSYHNAEVDFCLKLCPTSWSLGDEKSLLTQAAELIKPFRMRQAFVHDASVDSGH